MYVPATKWSWAYLLLSAAQMCTILAIEAYVFAEFQTSLIAGRPTTPAVKPVPTDLSLFIFGFIYQLVLVYDSLRLKNTIQVIGIVLFEAAFLIYAAIQVDQIHKAINTLISTNYIPATSDVWDRIQGCLIAVPCVIAFFMVLLAFIAWKLYEEFSWTIYKHISADLAMRRRFLTYQIYIALLKFDFFFFVGFTVQFLVVVTNVSDTEFALTVAAIPVTILILIAAAFFTRTERMIGSSVVILLYLGGLAYFIFKMARMYQPSREQDYLPARKTMTAFAVVTIVLIVVTIINAATCMFNFGKGLKPLIANRKITSEEEKLTITELGDVKPGMTIAPTRMTID